MSPMSPKVPTMSPVLPQAPTGSPVSSSATADIIKFGVWVSSSTCDMSAPHVTFTLDTTCACSLVTYTNAAGVTKTNSHFGWTCDASAVKFTQWVGNNQCDTYDSSGGPVINGDLTTTCTEVQTSQGPTHQMLIDYTAVCTGTGDQSGAKCSN
eukprot:Hpha_TRINITY_DN6790_c0_g1::TRINITY_DN6790_c0_g1_i2::g.110881::m.110881